jgi:hypothetical protein
MESTESQPDDDDDDMSAASAAFENNINNIDVQERPELFNGGVAPGFSVQLGCAAGLDQATSSEAAATTSQTTTVRTHRVWCWD